MSGCGWTSPRIRRAERTDATMIGWMGRVERVRRVMGASGLQWRGPVNLQALRSTEEKTSGGGQVTGQREPVEMARERRCLGEIVSDGERDD